MSLSASAALYNHLATGRWSSIIAHAWLHAFGVPQGMRAVPMADRDPQPSVGVITFADQSPSIVAKALLDTIEDLDIAATLDDAAGGLTFRQP